MVEKTVRMSLLFDFYGQLLTERQQEFFTLYYDHDLSLGEIAQQYGVSRQAVYDILRRSSQTLQGFEEKMGLVRRHEDQTSLVNSLVTDLHRVEKVLRAAGDKDGLVDQIVRVRRDLETLR